MSLLEAFLLGTLQALTEFLPVSSSGHLRLAHAFFGETAPEDLLFDLVLHLGTLAAVAVVFGKDIVGFVRSAGSGLRDMGRKGPRAALEGSEGLRMAVLIVLASVPTAIIGMLLKKPLESQAIGVVGVSLLLIANGAALWSSRSVPATQAEPKPHPLSVSGITPAKALLIGIAQGIAVLPGISRSGSTIVAALWLGAQRERAAQFSFLLAIPAILGAFVLQLGSHDEAAGQDSTSTAHLVGFAISAGLGVVALKLLLKLLRSARFHQFAWYCWGLGALALAAYALR